MRDSEDMLFFKDEIAGINIGTKGRWKVLIVDDDEQVHHTTRLVLDEFVFDSKALELFSAYSAAEAKLLLERNPDTAVILLDVVMEEKDSGLKLVKFVREVLKNSLVRIIIKTGQPGYAPERKVIMDYDINDYKEKTELTDDRFFTAMVSALRTYRDMVAIEKNRIGLESIIRSSADIYSFQSVNELASGVLSQLASILPSDGNAFFCKTPTFKTEHNDADLYIMAASGNYYSQISRNVCDALPKEICSELIETFRVKESTYRNNYSIIYFRNSMGSEGLAFLNCTRAINGYEKELAKSFCANFTAAFDNISINTEIIGGLREAVIVINAADNTVYCNDTFKNYFPQFLLMNYDLKLFSGYLRRYTEGIEPENNIIDAIESGINFDLSSELNVGEQGKKCYSVRVKPVYNAKKHILGRVVSFNDITEYRKLLDHMNEQNIQLCSMNEQLKKYASAIEEINIMKDKEKNRIVAEMGDMVVGILLMLLKLSDPDTPSHINGFALRRPSLVKALKEAINILKEYVTDENQLKHGTKVLLGELEDIAEACRAAGEKNGKSISGLDKTEIEILKLVARGKSNREIGSILNFEEGTIKNKVGEINRKISVASEIEKRCVLVSFAYEMGLVDEFNFV